MEHSTFSANSAHGTSVAKGDGGAIDNGDEYSSSGAFAISSSTFIDNTASVDGGDARRSYNCHSVSPAVGADLD